MITCFTEIRCSKKLEDVNVITIEVEAVALQIDRLLLFLLLFFACIAIFFQ